MNDYYERAQEIIDREVEAVRSVHLSSSLFHAVSLIKECKGKVVVCGMGKAGIIGKKISATFSSTGTPSIFLHPGEAQHGDLGVLSKDDLLLCLSNSGKTREIIETVELSSSICDIDVITITSDPESKLGKLSDLVLFIGNIPEACKFGLVPTSSTIAMLAMGDVLCLLTMELKGFTKEEYAKRHHGGYIGKKAREEV